MRGADPAQLQTSAPHLGPMTGLEQTPIGLRVSGAAEYWERYVRYLETSQDVPGARAALQRATLVHCKAQAEVHLFSALFEERHGDVEAARAAHVLVQVSLGCFRLFGGGAERQMCLQ